MKLLYALTLTESFDENIDDAELILSSRRQSHLLSNVGMFVISDMIKFLEPFQEATKILKGDQRPTLCIVTFQS